LTVAGTLTQNYVSRQWCRESRKEKPMYDAEDVHDGSPAAGGEPPARPLGRLKAERVQDRVREMPGWKVTRGGAAISRLFYVRSPQAQAHFLAFAGTLAQQAGRELAVTLVAEGLECRLTTPAAGGVTLQDLELAKEISLLG
jgi:pterin-4a-carbinolamine dehydratase